MKKLFSKLAVLVLGLAAVGGLATTKKSPVIVDATKGKGDETWSVIGKIKNPETGSYTSWDTDFDLSYKNSQYEITLRLEAKDEFKIRYNHDWDIQIKYGGNTGGGISTYLTSTGGDDKNFKVKTGDYYKLIVKDDLVANYEDKSYGFSIEKVTVTTHKIHYYYNGSEIATKEASDGMTYNAEFIHQNNLRLVGWYTNSSLTIPYVPTTLSKDLTLYGKYEESENFELYMMNTPKWTTPHVYLWSEVVSHHDNTWPGEAMTKVTGTDYWYVEIDTGYCWEKIIFNDGKQDNASQTVDLKLEDHTIIYKLTTKVGGLGDDKDKYNAITDEVRKVVAHVKGDTIEWTELAYEGSVATTNGFTVLEFNDGKIQVSKSSPSAEEMKEALIAKMETTDTCTSYDKYADYEELAQKVSGYESIVITDKDLATGSKTAKVTIGDKINYMKELASAPAAMKDGQSALNTLLVNNEENNNTLWILVAIMAVVSILGYVVFSRKRYVK